MVFPGKTIEGTLYWQLRYHCNLLTDFGGVLFGPVVWFRGSNTSSATRMATWTARIVSFMSADGVEARWAANAFGRPEAHIVSGFASARWYVAVGVAPGVSL